MKHFLSLLGVLLAMSICIPAPSRDANRRSAPGHAVSSDYMPRMVSCSYIETTVPEVSGLCLAPDGDGLLAAWSIPFVDNGEGIYVGHEHSCIWVGDDTTSRIYKIRFEGL